MRVSTAPPPATFPQVSRPDLSHRMGAARFGRRPHRGGRWGAAQAPHDRGVQGGRPPADNGAMAVTKITVSTAMRARDVSRPGAEHLAEAAEREEAVTRQPELPPPAPPPAPAAPAAPATPAAPA